MHYKAWTLFQMKTLETLFIGINKDQFNKKQNIIAWVMYTGYWYQIV